MKLCSSYRTVLAGSLAIASLLSPALHGQSKSFEFNDSHFHLTNYIQNGPDIHAVLRMMGDRVGRVALFGIPLQQQWSFRVSGDSAPSYYLNADTPLYYYSFTDAQIAMVFNSLTIEEKSRFDPMITGFNPSDMYAVDHIRRVLEIFPGVFSGIGEFSIHKEFVSSKVAGEVASLTDPALDRVLDFAGEVGLLVIIHNDIDTPFAKEGSKPAYLAQMLALFRRHPKTTIIWAHTGLGRVVVPVQHHAAVLAAIMKDPNFKHVYFDISWDQVARYILANPLSQAISASLINANPDRFLFGTDALAPSNPDEYFKLFSMYEPLWKRLGPEAVEKVRKGNYERLFAEARTRVRAWEKANMRANQSSR